MRFPPLNTKYLFDTKILVALVAFVGNDPFFIKLVGRDKISKSTGFHDIVRIAVGTSAVFGFSKLLVFHPFLQF